MKLNKREDIKVTLWVDDQVVTSENTTVYAEMQENDLFLLLKTNIRDYKIKISKYENFEEIESERRDGVQES